jgi:hypothetical protein
LCGFISKAGQSLFFKNSMYAKKKPTSSLDRRSVYFHVNVAIQSTELVLSFSKNKKKKETYTSATMQVALWSEP